MKSTLKQKSLDDLLAGIKQLLEKSRCPLSLEDQQLLVYCSEELQRLKAIELKNESVTLEEVSKITILILKVLDFFKDLF